MGPPVFLVHDAWCMLSKVPRSRAHFVHTLVTEEDLKNEHNLKSEDNLKNEHNLKNENDPKNEDNLSLW